jgi:3-carboxy-cis,cis-muconate cycloisomerase
VLRVDVDGLAAGVAAAAEPGLTQALTEALTPALGRGAAHDAAAAAARQARESGRPLAELLRERGDVDVDALLAAARPDPGEAGVQTDDVLAEHRRLTEGDA